MWCGVAASFKIQRKKKRINCIASVELGELIEYEMRRHKGGASVQVIEWLGVQKWPGHVERMGRKRLVE